MEPLSWTPQQREALNRAITSFKDYARTEPYRRHLQELAERKHFFQKELSGRLTQLSEADVEEIVGLLTAHRMWGNKAYKAQMLIKENGLEGLSRHLLLLYDSREDPEEGYERFMSSVKGWGPAAATELLAYIWPERCGIWSKHVRDALGRLGLEGRVPVRKYRLSKTEYSAFNNLLREIARELERAGFKDVDLLLADLLLYHLATAAETDRPAVLAAEAKEGFDHDEVRDLVAKIGTDLGFDTETEVRIAPGAQVDVVWRARIGNLGMVTYVFEVHRQGSVDSLILNLQRALNESSVQKVVAVSDRKQLERIQAESEGLSEQFRRALRLWDVDDVMAAGEALERAMTIIRGLGLLEKKKK